MNYEMTPVINVAYPRHVDPDILPQPQSEALAETLYRMNNVTIIGLDLDRVWLGGGKIPLRDDGLIDVTGLQRQSPETLPIIRSLNDFELHGIPTPTITGKSFTVLLLADLKRRMLWEEASKRGMLRNDYSVIPESAGILYSSEIAISEKYRDPATGRMRAIRNGEPSDLLVVSLFGFDNGSAWNDLSHPEGAWDRSKFPREFYKILLRPDIQQLLRDSTRQLKKDRQETIRPVYFGFPIHRDETDDIDRLSDRKLHQLAVSKVFDFSYPSPHGTKFNLELDGPCVIENPELRSRWTNLLRELTHDDNQQVATFDSLVDTIKLLFSTYATVSLNYVYEPEGMGRRLVVDLNPPDTNKLAGFQGMINAIENVYTAAGLHAPDFDPLSITIGDGPAKNDEQLICRPGGITNTDDPHEKPDGFPVDMMHIFHHFHISVLPRERLSDTEQTLLFLRLVAYCRLHRPLQNLPDGLQRKIHIPLYLESH